LIKGIVSGILHHIVALKRHHRRQVAIKLRVIFGIGLDHCGCNSALREPIGCVSTHLVVGELLARIPGGFRKNISQPRGGRIITALPQEDTPGGT
jgi:hypothetical protein